MALLLASQSYNLIINDVSFGSIEINEWKQIFSGYVVLYVGVMAPLHVLEERENSRGDRFLGRARGQYFKVHENMVYDLEVDSYTHSLEENIAKIKEALFKKNRSIAVLSKISHDIFLKKRKKILSLLLSFGFLAFIWSFRILLLKSVNASCLFNYIKSGGCMLYLGKVNSLTVLKKTIFGMFLVAEDCDIEVLLPNKYVPKGLDLDDPIDVFLYTDSEDRIVATTLTPKIFLHQIAMLEVKDVTKFGSFLDWGLEKDLFLPFSEQNGKAQKGEKIAVCLCLDDRTDRLFASAKIKDFVDQKITVKEGDEVDLLIGDESDLGYQVVINNLHIGLVFFNKVFQPLRKGDKVKGFIEKIREDGKIDVSLQKKGYTQVIDSQSVLLKKLQENRGVLYLTDDSDPEVIVRELLMSKKVFKKCLGALYKQRKIKIEEDRIVLL